MEINVIKCLHVGPMYVCKAKGFLFCFVFFFQFLFPCTLLWSGGVEKKKTHRHGPPDLNLNQLKIMYIQQCLIKMT